MSGYQVDAGGEHTVDAQLLALYEERNTLQLEQIHANLLRSKALQKEIDALDQKILRLKRQPTIK